MKVCRQWDTAGPGLGQVNFFHQPKWNWLRKEGLPVMWSEAPESTNHMKNEGLVDWNEHQRGLQQQRMEADHRGPSSADVQSPRVRGWQCCPLDERQARWKEKEQQQKHCCCHLMASPNQASHVFAGISLQHVLAYCKIHKTCHPFCSRACHDHKHRHDPYLSLEMSWRPHGGIQGRIIFKGGSASTGMRHKHEKETL